MWSSLTEYQTSPWPCQDTNHPITMSSLTLPLRYQFWSLLLYRHNHVTTRPLRKAREKATVWSSSSGLQGRGCWEVGEGNQAASEKGKAPSCSKFLPLICLSLFTQSGPSLHIPLCAQYSWTLSLVQVPYLRIMPPPPNPIQSNSALSIFSHYIAIFFTDFFSLLFCVLYLLFLNSCLWSKILIVSLALHFCSV